MLPRSLACHYLLSQKFSGLIGTSCIELFSIITQVIIEIMLTWLVENCVISCYNDLARGDYSGSTNIQNGSLAGFVDVSEEEVNRKQENAIPKGSKDAAKSGVSFFVGKIWKFC